MIKYLAAAVVFAFVVPMAAFSQTLNPALPGAVGSNPVPGGLTLVPGTVVIPGVSGATNTGTVPLPGTAGSPGIVLPLPGGSGTETLSNTAAGISGGLYPPAYYPSFPVLGAGQNTVPQTNGALTPPTIVTPEPSVNPNCADIARCRR